MKRRNFKYFQRKFIKKELDKLFYTILDVRKINFQKPSEYGFIQIKNK